MAVTSTHHSDGGDGATDLAEVVAKLADENDGSEFQTLYDDSLSISDKVRSVATKIYRAKDIAISPEAAKKFDVSRS